MTGRCVNCGHYDHRERQCGIGEVSGVGDCWIFECACQGDDPSCDCEREAIRDFVADERTTRDMEAQP